jgi:hypothetical protein
LEDVGVWSVRAEGHRAGPAAVAEGALAVFEPADRGWGGRGRPPECRVAMGRCRP